MLRQSQTGRMMFLIMVQSMFFLIWFYFTIHVPLHFTYDFKNKVLISDLRQHLLISPLLWFTERAREVWLGLCLLPMRVRANKNPSSESTLKLWDQAHVRLNG